MNHQTHRRFKDIDPKIKVTGFLGLVTILIALALIFGSCKKESSFTSPKGIIESDRHLKPKEGYNLTKRAVSEELMKASKGRGRGPKPKDTTGTDPQPPTDTTGTDPQPPTPSNLLYADFDGEVVSGTQWNVNGDINCAYSGMTAVEIDTAFSRMKRQYEALGFQVTMDRATFFLGAASHRQQLIITESWEWFGQAGGVAYLYSYSWSTPAPCFVFSSLLGYSGKFVSDAGIHEWGHTLGLRHVPQPDGSSQYCTYGNWMGTAYYVPWGFFESSVKDQSGNYVNQFTTISNNL